jgi:hypothetical protein
MQIMEDMRDILHEKTETLAKKVRNDRRDVITEKDAYVKIIKDFARLKKELIQNVSR